jgi:Beta-galactosidase trimerisation domain
MGGVVFVRCCELLAFCAKPRISSRANKSSLSSWRVVSLWLGTIAAASFFSCGCPLIAEDASAITAPWLAHARIAGAELFSEMTAGEIAQNLSALADQNVSVVEADSDLSRFLTEKEFQAEIALMRRYCEAAHALGMKVVWYYPALEVLSPNAKRGNRSMYQTHPTWVQRGLDGKPNVFFGGKHGKTRVHWVDPNTESAWMSFHSPYADMLVDRIKRIAATGVDGIWLDVPIYNDIGAEWADAGPGAAAKFQADSGMEMPKTANWSDPAWRRWIAWRYREITNFISRVRDAVKSEAADVTIVVETVTLDYGAATMLGLDGSTMKTTSGVIQVWEVDAVSDKTAMRDARPDDWICLIGMSKFAKAASGKKPSWILTYGKEPDDGMLVMAEALAAGNNPYETKIPKMTTTVGAAYRKRMFSWIKQEERRLFESFSAARIAVYFSPESRDYVDKAAGTGLFATTKSKDALWWSTEPVNSVYSLTYLAEYRGIIKWLVHNHVPFDIVVRPDAGELSRFDAVIAPSLVALSDQVAGLLDRYVAAGGHLIVTGPSPAALDELGNPRSAAILKSLAQRDGPQLSALTWPAGTKVVHTAELVGKSYLTSDSTAASQAIRELLGEHAHSPIETNADKSVHIELRKSGNETLLHLINPERLWNAKAARKQDVTVSIELPPDVTVADVRLTSPELLQTKAQNEIKNDQTARPGKTGQPPRPGKPAPAGSRQAEPQSAAVKSEQGAGKTLPFTVEGHRVFFTVPLEAYEMVVVSTQPR